MSESDASVFYQLPAVMPMPHRPQGEEDLLRWATEVHSSIYDSYIPQADRIENATMVGETLDERPDPIGSRRYFYHRPAKALYLDVRYGATNVWDVVFAEGTSTVILDTTDFDKILSDADSALQDAMDTLDDHIHAAEEITVDTGGFSGILGSGDSEVQDALESIDVHGHSEYLPLTAGKDYPVTGTLFLTLATSEPADGDLENGEAVFWYDPGP